MSGTLQVGGVTLGTHNSGTGKVDLTNAGVTTVTTLNTTSIASGTLGSSVVVPASVGSSLVLIKTETYPTATTWTVEDCFSSTYAMHMICFTDLTVSSNCNMHLQLIDESGTVNTTASHDWMQAASRQPGTSYQNGGNNVAYWRLVHDYEALGNPFSATMYIEGIFNPLASPSIHGTFQSYDDGYGARAGSMGGVFKVQSSTNYDGFKLTCSSGNIDGGRITVYGLKHTG